MSHLTCEQARPFWPIYLDGELADNDARIYLEHLNQCIQCREFIEGEQRFRRVFRRKMNQNEIAPEKLRIQIEKLAGATQSSWVSSRWLTAGLTLSFAFVMTASQKRISQPMPVLQQVMKVQQQTIPLEVVTNNVKEAEDFAAQHVGKVKIPHLNVRGAQLAGARVVTLPGSQQKALFVHYNVGSSTYPVSLAVYPNRTNQVLNAPRSIDSGKHRIYLEKTDNGLRTASWQNQDAIYSVIGNMDELQMLNLVPADE